MSSFPVTPEQFDALTGHRCEECGGSGRRHLLYRPPNFCPSCDGGVIRERYLVVKRRPCSTGTGSQWCDYARDTLGEQCWGCLGDGTRAAEVDTTGGVDIYTETCRAAAEGTCVPACPLEHCKSVSEPTVRREAHSDNVTAIPVYGDTDCDDVFPHIDLWKGKAQLWKDEWTDYDITGELAGADLQPGDLVLEFVAAPA